MHYLPVAAVSIRDVPCMWAVCRAKVVVTATGVWRGPRTMPLKSIVDKALAISKQGGHQVKSRPRVVRQATG